MKRTQPIYRVYRTAALIGISISAGLAVFAAPACAATLTTLATFDGYNGKQPMGGLLLDDAGNLYGTTAIGNGAGTIFKIAPDGTLTTLTSFSGASSSPQTDGSFPNASLIADKAGNLYGTTFEGGGASQDGTVFKLAPDGTFTTLAIFTGVNGARPDGPLTADVAGNLYGTTMYGGTYNYGTLFKVAPDGTLTTLVEFSGYNGGYPSGNLAIDADGDLYGTTWSGEFTRSAGTVFKLAPDGTLSTLCSFDGNDGENPAGGVILHSDGNLYGTTANGGAYYDGTIFKIAPDGTPTKLADLISQTFAGLLMDEAGNLYGTTSYGGMGRPAAGTVFKLAPDGQLTTLVSFDNANGGNPAAGLIADSAGNLYGTTEYGGRYGYGTVFKIEDSGFVVPEPSSSALLAMIGIVLLPRRKRK